MNLKNKIKQFLKSKTFSWVLMIAIIAMLLQIIFYKGKDLDKEATTDEAKQVSVERIISNSDRGAAINTVGKVLPVNSVDVVALSQGTIQGIFFEIGDEVEKNQTLAFVSNDLTSNNLSSAQTTYLNMLNNMDVIRRSADEQVRQAEIGVENAAESVRLAEISLESAEDNYENSQDIQKQNNKNIKENAVLAYTDHLSFAKKTLNDVNYIIGAEAGEQIPGISATLASKNKQSLILAENNYLQAKNAYLQLNGISPNKDNILTYLYKISDLMKKIKGSVSDTVEVLENTTANRDFSESTLVAQRQAY
ncbi:hypothetical protein GF382_02160, partial [Candidatus Falkowbacteria bacterium]|nr:hypothetical protein [Candidatus Falkowbacteria bacterium]